MAFQEPLPARPPFRRARRPTAGSPEDVSPPDTPPSRGQPSRRRGGFGVPERGARSMDDFAVEPISAHSPPLQFNTVPHSERSPPEPPVGRAGDTSLFEGSQPAPREPSGLGHRPPLTQFALTSRVRMLNDLLGPENAVSLVRTTRAWWFYAQQPFTSTSPADAGWILSRAVVGLDQPGAACGRECDRLHCPLTNQQHDSDLLPSAHYSRMQRS